MSSINEIIDSYVKDNNIAITAAPGNGVTTFTLSLINELVKTKYVVYFTPCDNIERGYVKEHYPYAYGLCTFIVGDISLLLDYIYEFEHMVDYVVIDPADMYASQFNLLRTLHTTSIDCGFKLILTGQIRQNPNEGGNTYSTLDKLNKKAINTRTKIFDYSLWISDVTEPSNLVKNRYVDVYHNYRTGNRYVKRYIIRFNKIKGNVE